jgi:hypothetical protein
MTKNTSSVMIFGIAQHIFRFQAVNNIQLPSHNIISTCTTAPVSRQSYRGAHDNSVAANANAIGNQEAK